MAIFVCARRTTFVFLTIGLVLTILRQVFDIIGRLWLPMLINFMHALFLIFGYFGVWQYRPVFVIVNAFWIPFSLTWNVFISCYYMSVRPLDRDSALLSFGLRMSKSFWVEHTPFCAASYDFTSDTWTLHSDCLLPYYYVEVATAAVNFIVAFLTFDTMLVFLCAFPHQRHLKTKKRTSPPNEYTNSVPRVLVPNTVPANTTAHRPTVDTSVDVHHGLDDTVTRPSYSDEDTMRAHNYTPNVDATGRLTQNYARRPEKQKTRRQREAEASYYGETVGTAAITQRYFGDDNGSGAQTRRPRANSVSQNVQRHSTMDTGAGDMPFDVTRPLHNFAVVRTPQRQTSLTDLTAAAPSPHSALRPVVISGGSGRWTVRTQPAAARADSDAASRRLSVTEPRGIRNSNDSVLNERRTSERKYSISSTQRALDSQPTSLISFDPKSNTLIRCHQMGQSRVSVESLIIIHEYAGIVTRRPMC
jgi:hypothetical protein